jgi:hypothetical protein
MPVIKPVMTPRKKLNLQDTPITQEITNAIPILHRNEMR